MAIGTGNYGAGERRARIFEKKKKQDEGGQLRKKDILRRAVGKSRRMFKKRERH